MEVSMDHALADQASPRPSSVQRFHPSEDLLEPAPNPGLALLLARNPGSLQALQRAAGNRAVSRLMGTNVHAPSVRRCGTDGCTDCAKDQTEETAAAQGLEGVVDEPLVAAKGVVQRAVEDGDRAPTVQRAAPFVKSPVREGITEAATDPMAGVAALEALTCWPENERNSSYQEFVDYLHTTGIKCPGFETGGMPNPPLRHGGGCTLPFFSIVGGEKSGIHYTDPKKTTSYVKEEKWFCAYTYATVQFKTEPAYCVMTWTPNYNSCECCAKESAAWTHCAITHEEAHAAEARRIVARAQATWPPKRQFKYCDENKKVAQKQVIKLMNEEVSTTVEKMVESWNSSPEPPGCDNVFPKAESCDPAKAGQKCCADNTCRHKCQT
jgi:hypothetical protein